jgi:endonuclease/exonuclease/phosphatase family metal-dependent hydrolase
MKLLTWNLWQYSVPWGYDRPRGIVAAYPPEAPRPDAGALWARRRAMIRAVLAAERPDLVLLQECATDADAAPGAPNQAWQVAPPGYQVVYRPASMSRRRAAEHGQALLAAPGWTIRDQEVLDLPSGGRLSKDSTRNVLRVDLAGPGGVVRVLNAHLSLDAGARLRGVDQILAWAADLPPVPATLLAGDLNDVPTSAPITRLAEAGWRDCWAALHPADPGLTFATPEPFIRLDYVFLAPGSRLAPVTARRVGLAPDPAGFYPSDHAGALVEFSP